MGVGRARTRRACVRLEVQNIFCPIAIENIFKAEKSAGICFSFQNKRKAIGSMDFVK